MSSVNACTDFVFGRLSPSDFESWLYGAGEAEELFSGERYLALIALDYRELTGRLQARRHIADFLKGSCRAVFDAAAAQAVDRHIAAIAEAFDGVSRVGGMSYHQAKVSDNDGSTEDFKRAAALDTELRWQEAQPEVVLAHSTALAFLDPCWFSLLPAGGDVRSVAPYQ